MHRLPGLDLLRAIAIVWVMLYHARVAGLGRTIDSVSFWGWMGVDLFFVLSGFLIGSQLFKPLAQGGKIKLGDFYLRRALRVLPAYLVIVALYFSWPHFRETREIQPLWQFLTFSENLFIDFFRPKAFSHVWSLCVEEHFYLLAPLLTLALMRRPAWWKAVGLMLGLLIGGMWLRGHIWVTELGPILGIEEGVGNFGQRYMERIYYPTPTRLDGLLAGVSLALIAAFRPDWWAAMQRWANWLLAAGAAVFAVALWIFQDRDGLFATVAGFPLLALGLGLIVASAASEGSLLSRWRVPGAALLATMAYSLYLTHKAVYHLVRAEIGPWLKLHDGYALLCYGAAALAGGALLYLAVERPALRWRDRRWAAKAAQPVPQAA